MVPIPFVIEDISRMSWPDCSIGGTCHGALGEISMSLAFLVKDRVKAIFVQQWWSSQISFFSRGFMDISLVGVSFMWSNKSDVPSWSKIDRFLVSPEWEAQFPDLT